MVMLLSRFFSNKTTGFFILNIQKKLDPSYKTDLDFWDCFGGEKLIKYLKAKLQLFRDYNG